MAKYLIEASYTLEGVKGLVKDGGLKRKEAAAAAIKSAGGTLEAFYFSFGEIDAVLIADLPNNINAVACSVAINASGAVHSKTTPLLTAEELDEALKQSVNYRAPGR
jgi:uncharacterized protein with GYD domain